jgi:hypothetical protein
MTEGILRWLSQKRTSFIDLFELVLQCESSKFDYTYKFYVGVAVDMNHMSL